MTASAEPFAFRWIVASSLYGRLPLTEILPEVPKLGASCIDLWPEGHANQREQMDELGHEAFADLLADHGVTLGMTTRYDLGPFGLAPEFPVLKRFGARLVVTGSKGPKGLEGEELKRAVAEFVEAIRPHAENAQAHGVTIAIENHGSALIQSPDSLRWFAELAPAGLGVALAPYHLPQDARLIAGLIRDLDKRLVHFYAWQYGKGCMTKLPKEEELLQMPGRGDLSFTPIVAALRDSSYAGWTSVFMHPVPRGIPILPTAAEVTAEIARAQEYVTGCLNGES